MYEKMQESGLTEIIPFICISAIWGQYPAFSLSAQLQVLFLLGALGAQKFTFEGLESWMAVTSLFTDMTGNSLSQVELIAWSFQISRYPRWLSSTPGPCWDLAWLTDLIPWQLAVLGSCWPLTWTRKFPPWIWSWPPAQAFQEIQTQLFSVLTLLLLTCLWNSVRLLLFWVADAWMASYNGSVVTVSPMTDGRASVESLSTSILYTELSTILPGFKIHLCHILTLWTIFLHLFFISRMDLMMFSWRL